MTGTKAETAKTSEPPFPLKIFRSVLKNVALALAVLILPVFGIRRSADLGSLPLCELILYLIYLIAAALAGVATAMRDSGGKTTPLPLSAPTRIELIRSLLLRYLKRRFTLMVALTIVLLYVSCAALLQRLGFASTASWSDLAAWLGVLLVAGGAIVQTLCLFEEPHKQATANGGKAGIRHPLHTAWLLALLGIPLIYGSWVPYAALPGVIVLINWRMRRIKSEIEEQVEEVSTG